MSPEALRGKQQILGLSLIQIFFSANIIYVSYASHLNDKLATQTIRFLLTCALLFAVYKGKDWARVLMGGLAGVAALVGLVGVLTRPLFTEASNFMLIMVMAYGVIAYVFLFSEDIKTYYAFLDDSETIPEEDE